MNRSESPAPDSMQEDDIPSEIDFSSGRRANTAYRFGEDRDDELQIERFLQSLGLELVSDLDSHREPDRQRSLAVDFLLKRNGTPKAICEIKSIGQFDYLVRILHEDGTSTTSGNNFLDSDIDRALRLAKRAADQFAYSDPDHTLTRVFIFVNHLETLRREDLQSQLLAIPGVDATLWFEARDGVIGSEAIVITTDAGRQELQQLSLTLEVEVRLKMTSAA